MQIAQNINFSRGFNKIIEIILFLYIFLCLIFPATDILINKKIAFVLCLAFFCVACFMKPLIQISKRIVLKAYVVFLIPIVFMIISFFNVFVFSEGVFIIISCISVFIVLFFNIIDERKIFKIFLIVCFFLALFTIVLAILPSISAIISVAANSLFLSFDSGYLGLRVFCPR